MRVTVAMLLIDVEPKAQAELQSCYHVGSGVDLAQ